MHAPLGGASGLHTWSRRRSPDSRRSAGEADVLLLREFEPSTSRRRTLASGHRCARTATWYLTSGLMAQQMADEPRCDTPKQTSASGPSDQPDSSP